MDKCNLCTNEFDRTREAHMQIRYENPLNSLVKNDWVIYMHSECYIAFRNRPRTINPGRLGKY